MERIKKHLFVIALLFAFCIGLYDAHLYCDKKPTPRALWNYATAIIRESKVGEPVDFEEAYKHFWFCANYLYAFGGPYEQHMILSNTANGMLVSCETTGEQLVDKDIAQVKPGGKKYWGSIYQARQITLKIQGDLK